MRTLRVIGVVIVALFALIVGVAFVLPPEYDVERTVVIDAPPECPFDHVDDLEKNVVWSPWKATDPTMVIEMGDVTVGEGASYSWTSDRAGDGSYTIIVSQPHRRLESSVDLGDRGSARGSWRFEYANQRTTVTWHFVGQPGTLVGRYEALVMDSALGPDFAHGLDRMKQICEA